MGRGDVGWNGAVTEIEICIRQSSDQGDNPVVKAQLAKQKDPQTIQCAATQGRYILLRAHTEFSEHQFASIAELGVMGE